MLYNAVRPILFGCDPERVHEEVTGLLTWLSHIPGAGTAVALATGAKPSPAPRTVFGVRFPNPLGLAAGFDKDGRFPALAAALGFGFVEIGSVTLEPQPGNPRPRLFRAVASRALINRMGFNGAGARDTAQRLSQTPPMSVPLGINLGLNKGTPSAAAPAAYARTMRILSAFGDYFVVNVSSPNTPGLRDLQRVEDLTSIMKATQDANATHKPVLIKLSPDLAEADFDAAVASARGLAQGLVISNTTLSRDGVGDDVASEAGGLSGAPLKTKALALLRRARALTDLPIVACGGIETAADAADRLAAGADLLQIYSSLVFEGPSHPKALLRDLAARA